MNREILVVLVCLPLCLLLVPERAPVALSVPAAAPLPALEAGSSATLADDPDQLAAKDPVAFLEYTLRKQGEHVKGYCGILKKQERIGGTVHPTEVIEFSFREKPYSVLMKWREGARNGKASLFVEGLNKNRVAVLTNTRIPVSWDLDPNGRIAQAAARYAIYEFSLRQGTERTWKAWSAAQKKGILQVEYLGKKPVAELDGRVCYMLRRTCNPPEEEGVVTVDVVIDAENLLQIGSVLIDGHDQLIGRYQFTGLTVNPDYEADRFDRSQIKK